MADSARQHAAIGMTLAVLNGRIAGTDRVDVSWHAARVIVAESHRGGLWRPQ